MSYRVAHSFTAAATVALVCSSVSAHIEVTAPTPRVPGADNLKSTPCGAGNSWGQGEVLTFAPGEAVTVEWDETIPHAGYFRVVIGTGGDASLTMPSEEDYEAFTAYYGGGGDIPVPVENPAGAINGDMIVYYDYWGEHDGQTCAGTQAGGTCSYSVEVTMPDSCTECTLQVVQTMAEAFRTYGTNAHYYHCVDFNIEGEPMGEEGGMGGMGGEEEGSGGGGMEMPEMGAGAAAPGMEPEMMGAGAAGGDSEGTDGTTNSSGGSMGDPPVVTPVNPTPAMPTTPTAVDPGPPGVTPPSDPPPTGTSTAGGTPPPGGTGMAGTVAQSGAGMPMTEVMSGSGGDDGGCTFAASPTRTHAWGLMLGLAAFVGWLRRRG